MFSDSDASGRPSALPSMAASSRPVHHYQTAVVKTHERLGTNFAAAA